MHVWQAQILSPHCYALREKSQSFQGNAGFCCRFVVAALIRQQSLADSIKQPPALADVCLIESAPNGTQTNLRMLGHCGAPNLIEHRHSKNLAVVPLGGVQCIATQLLIATFIVTQPKEALGQLRGVF